MDDLCTLSTLASISWINVGALEDICTWLNFPNTASCNFLAFIVISLLYIPDLLHTFYVAETFLCWRRIRYATVKNDHVRTLIQCIVFFWSTYQQGSFIDFFNERIRIQLFKWIIHLIYIGKTNVFGTTFAFILNVFLLWKFCKLCFDFWRSEHTKLKRCN